MPTYNRKYSCADLQKEVYLAMERLGFTTQYQLASLTSISQGTISQILKGNAERGVNLETAQRLAKILGFTLPTVRTEYKRKVHRQARETDSQTAESGLTSDYHIG